MKIAGNLLRSLLLLLLTLPLSGHAAGFLFEDIQGKTHRLADYRGKWVLVNFWATWCPPCLTEIPELASLHKAHKGKDLVVISIAMDSGPSKKVSDFSQAHGINYPIVNWEWQKNQKLDQEITKNFGDIEVVPSSFLYNPKGELVAQQLGGEVTRENIESYIKNKKID